MPYWQLTYIHIKKLLFQKNMDVQNFVNVQIQAHFHCRLHPALPLASLHGHTYVCYLYKWTLQLGISFIFNNVADYKPETLLIEVRTHETMKMSPRQAELINGLHYICALSQVCEWKSSVMSHVFWAIDKRFNYRKLELTLNMYKINFWPNWNFTRQH